MTSAELLQQTAKRLKRHGIEDPQIEARILLGHAVELSAEQLLACLDMHPTQSQVEKLEQFIARRISHEPIAYIIQHKDFYGLSYYVDHRVLIPRPETELLVEKSIDFAQNRQHDHDLKIADIGTGSGAIAISLAIHLVKSTIFAIDISAAALEVASINCAKHGVANKIRLFQGDLLNPLPVLVDIIVANLPYITASDMAGLPPEIRGFEPVNALNGGDDGLQYIERLLRQAKSKIRPDGCILLEIGLGQRPAIEALVKDCFSTGRITFFKDFGGIDRVMEMRLNERVHG